MNWQTTDGRVIVIPEEFPTIQVGFESLQNGDTLLIRAGRYEEALTAPTLTFVMIGGDSAEPGNFTPVTVDASDLVLPHGTPVLQLPDSSDALIKRIRFMNRRRTGIVASGLRATFEHCIIDSAFNGFEYLPDNANAMVTFRDCIVRGHEENGVFIQRGNSLLAVGCEFVGSVEYRRSILSVRDGKIDSCHFSSSVPKLLLYASQGDLEVTNCVFGPALPGDGEALVSVDCRKTVFAGNEFRDCVFYSHVLHLHLDFADSTEIINNTFIRCKGPGGDWAAQGVLSVFSQDEDAVHGPLIAGNTFIECSGNSFVDDLNLVPFATYRVFGNHFVRDSLNGLPSIGMSSSPWQPTAAVLRGNVFEECGYAVTGNGSADARWNYWGDPSGPYQATLNPQGLGDTITGDVQFIPWLADTTTSARETRPELATEVMLAAQPNPFNMTTTLSFTLADAAHVELTIFDLLGREVTTLLDRRMTSGAHSISFDAAAFSSGVYFARLVTARHSAATKLILLK